MAPENMSKFVSLYIHQETVINNFVDDWDATDVIDIVNAFDNLEDGSDVPEVKENVYDAKLREMTQRQDITINQLEYMTKAERNEIWQEIQQYLVERTDICFDIDSFERYIVANYEPERDDEDYYSFDGETITYALGESVSPYFRHTYEFNDIADTITHEYKFISTILNSAFRNQFNLDFFYE